LHEMHLAQTVFEELERIARRNKLTKVSMIFLKVLDADTHCLVESLKMLIGASPLLADAEIKTTESPQAADPGGARVIIERIEGEQD